ncbi:MAG TPA: glycine cleavage system aminomethyltransferase GcvT [Geminicoccaceae bacterium]
MTEPSVPQESPGQEPAKTPLYDLHRELGGKLVDFAGWMLPVQYPSGIMHEHQHCREAAALFDVSHMGQVIVRGARAPEVVERLVPADLQALGLERQRYTVLTNDDGGILDDLIIGRVREGLFIVVNAARREHDVAYMKQALEPDCSVEPLEDRALLALQGPRAADVMFRLAPASADLTFMSSGESMVAGISCRISRSGYTGEDGFEISVPAGRAEALARRLLEEEEVAPAGLGARDSLRLEAGLSLYGHDLTPETTPVEAGLTWTIQKRRRADGGFPGDAVILKQLADGPPRRLVGIRPDGRAPAREGAEIQDEDGARVGRITSGGFGPTVGGPVALGYVDRRLAASGSRVQLVVRGRPYPATVADLPFVPHNYKR